MSHRDTFLSILISSDEFECDFMLIQLVFNNCFIDIKHCADHMIVTKLIIHVDQNEAKIKWWIIRRVFDSRSHTDVQIDSRNLVSRNMSRSFRCVVISHDEAYLMILLSKTSTVVTDFLDWSWQLDKMRELNVSFVTCKTSRRTLTIRKL